MKKTPKKQPQPTVNIALNAYEVFNAMVAIADYMIKTRIDCKNGDEKERELADKVCSVMYDLYQRLASADETLHAERLRLGRAPAPKHTDNVIASFAANAGDPNLIYQAVALPVPTDYLPVRPAPQGDGQAPVRLLLQYGNDTQHADILEITPKRYRIKRIYKSRKDYAYDPYEGETSWISKTDKRIIELFYK